MPGTVSGTPPVPIDHPADVHVAPNVRAAGPIDFELTSAIRRIFLAPASGVRSVLFCTVPGEELGDIAKEAARALSAQSGQRVAFVEYTSKQLAEDRIHIPDLFTSFAFVIVTATSSSLDQLVSLAHEVDGVIVVVTRDQTRIDSAHTLVATLRQGRANLLGTIFEERIPFRYS